MVIFLDYIKKMDKNYSHRNGFLKNIAWLKTSVLLQRIRTLITLCKFTHDMICKLDLKYPNLFMKLYKYYAKNKDQANKPSL